LTSRLAPWVAGWGLSLAQALSAAAQSPVPVGNQFQINTYTPNLQGRPIVAADSSGDWIAVWVSDGSPGTDVGPPGYTSIQGQRYASDGSAQGAQFQVNSYTTAAQGFPSVAMAPEGRFVVVWESFRSSGTDPLGYSIQGQRFGSDGSSLGAQFQINTYTTSEQHDPDVAVAEDGDFVVVWTSDGSSETDASSRSVHGQRYASDGSTQGAQFQVNGYTTNAQSYPAVASAANGDFVVVWTSYGSDGTDTGYLGNSSVQGRRYASDGSPQGVQFQVNSYTTGSQRYPSVAADAAGEFVVVWEGLGSYGSDTDQYDLSIQGQRYSPNGSPEGAQFQVNSYTTSNQIYPEVTLVSDGGFIVVWMSEGGYGSDPWSASAQGQRYASDGSPRGVEFQVNTYTEGRQGNPSVAALSDAGFVVAWSSQTSPGTDTTSDSVQGQRYFVPAVIAPALSPRATIALAAILLLFGAACGLRRRS
jgi:hypothetical protein